MKKIEDLTTLKEFKKKNKAKIQTKEFNQAYEVAELAYQTAVKIRKLREKAGLTQTELAQLMGSTQPAIARLETGGGNPNLDTLNKIAAAIGYEVSITFKKLTS